MGPDPVHIYINSKRRTLPSNTSNFFYYSPEIESIRNKNEYTKITLLRASIPKTYYLINENSFTLIEGNTRVNLSLPQGKYNIENFRERLAHTLQQGSSHGFMYHVLSDTLEQFEAPITGKYTFTVEGNDELQIPIAIELYGVLYEQMGFDAHSVNYFVNNTLTSKYVYNMNREATLFIHSDLCQNDSNNTLQDIFTVSSETNSYIAWENPNPFLTAKKINNLTPIHHVILTDEDEQDMDLNGGNINLTYLIF